jgi:hypothetical protein
MTTPLVHIDILSCYRVKNERKPLPERMAKCTPDTYRAIMAIREKMEAKGGKLVLSDMFRSFDMQYQSNMDYESGKKKAFSPPPGGSLHESGRVIGLQLIDMKISLADFWIIAREFNMLPIIKKPDDSASEAWHFDHAGSHRLVEAYAKRHNSWNSYGEMAASAILSEGIKALKFKDRQIEANIQYSLVRLGYELGVVDGWLGKNSKAALTSAGIDPSGSHEKILEEVELLLRVKFPEEYDTQELVVTATT